MTAFGDTMKDAAAVGGLLVIIASGLRWLVGLGEKKAAIEKSIADGFASVRTEVGSVKAEFAANTHEVKASVTALGERVAGQIGSLNGRMDKSEARAEAEAQERAKASAVEAERRTREAQEHGQTVERARQLEADVADLSAKVDGLAKTTLEQHEDLRERLSNVDKIATQTRTDLVRLDGHVKGHSAALQAQQTKLAVIERGASRPARRESPEER